MNTLQQKCGVAISALLKGYHSGSSQVIQTEWNALPKVFAKAHYADGCKGVGGYFSNETAIPCPKPFPLIAGSCDEMCNISERPRSFDFPLYSILTAFMSCMLSIVGQCTLIVDHLRLLFNRLVWSFLYI